MSLLLELVCESGATSYVYLVPDLFSTSDYMYRQWSRRVGFFLSSNRNMACSSSAARRKNTKRSHGRHRRATAPEVSVRRVDRCPTSHVGFRPAPEWGARRSSPSCSPDVNTLTLMRAALSPNSRASGF